MHIPEIKLNNGVMIPAIGAGTMRLNEEAIYENICAGYRSLDTAMIYGNEAAVAAAIQRSGIPRDEFFITTKLWNEDIRNRNARKAFEASCKKLNTDYVDLYLLHWPVDGRVEAWKELEALYREGKIRAIGVSNFNPWHLKELFEVSEIIPAVNQVELHPHFAQYPLKEFCDTHGICLEAWSLNGGGRLVQDAALTELAAKYNKTATQLILRWDMQRRIVPLPRSTNPERIRQNLDIFDFEISDEDMFRIGQMHIGQRNGADPDTVQF